MTRAALARRATVIMRCLRRARGVAGGASEWMVETVGMPSERAAGPPSRSAYPRWVCTRSGPHLGEVAADAPERRDARAAAGCHARGSMPHARSRSAT